MNINTNGYIIIKQLFSKHLLTQCKREILEYTQNNKQIQNADGITIPDFINQPELSLTASLKDLPALHKILEEEVFKGEDYRFCSHNDIGINRIVGWHKDKLNGPYAKYEAIPIWSTTPNGEKHEIYKVLVFLNNQEEFYLVPGSHTKSVIDVKGGIPIETELGDVLIFDQRITHRGADKHYNEGDRILVSFGFGRNNPFTDNFEKGTIQRQNDQNNTLRNTR
jgi:hypothetical protein